VALPRRRDLPDPPPPERDPRGGAVGDRAARAPGRPRLHRPRLHRVPGLVGGEAPGHRGPGRRGVGRADGARPAAGAHPAQRLTGRRPRVAKARIVALTTRLALTLALILAVTFAGYGIGE